MDDAPTPHDEPRTDRRSSSRRNLLTGAAGAVITGVAAGALLGAEPAAAAVPDDASVTPPKFHPDAIDAAANVPSARTLGDGPTQAGSGEVLARVRARDVDPHDFLPPGADVSTAGAGKTAIEAAMAAAQANGGGGVLHLRPNTIYDVGTGLVLSGYSTGIRGGGGFGTQATVHGTLLKTTSPTAGPVLDLNGFIGANWFGKTIFAGFGVEGSNVDRPENLGIVIHDVDTGNSISGFDFRQIGVRKTGGTCLKVGIVYASVFDAITLTEPVNAAANDTPYLHIAGSNSSAFSNIGFRGMSASPNCGVSGAAVIEGTGGPAVTWHLHGITCSSWAFQSTHPSDGGTIVSIESSVSSYRDFRWYDCTKPVGATSTSFVTFMPRPGMSDRGGNLYHGYVPGRDDASPGNIDYGIVVKQGHNSITGTRGYGGYNVQRVGEIRLDVHLTGSEGAPYSGGPSVVHTVGTNSYGYCKVRETERGFEGFKVADVASLPPASSDRRGQFRMVYGGAGVGDQLKVCMKKADGTYIWATIADPANPNPT